MKQKTFTIMLAAVLVLALAIGGVALFRDVNRNKFDWQYLVTTDEKWRTLQNDGGSMTNVYYRINFDRRQVQKCEDKYFGPMRKYDYRDKIIYEKTFDEQLAQKIQEVLEKVWQAGDPNEGNEDYYVVEKADAGPRYILSKNPMTQLAASMEKFDKLP